ncbi:WYL domain-containing protein [Streptomyces sp. NPDC001404]|uniref:WYL domain-containing protein n=1 Tax=Streptomyces sp. NPDC001404 TaxID=3364571 RepID=UPI003695E3AF
MKITARQTSTTTLTDLTRAADRQQPVTITYIKADGTETVRTIEIYDIRTTKAGDLILKAMDRQSGESRTFRLDRLIAYTVHRSTYTLPVKEHRTVTVELVSVNTPDELVCRELAREDREYWTDFYDHAA